MKFSKHHGIRLNQSELDFVDVDPKKDTPLYVDPYAIEMSDDETATQCNHILRQFFQELIDAIQKGNRDRISQLVSNFKEPGDTFLGVSKGEPQGRGVGDVQAQQIVAALSKSRAAISGNLRDLSETTLFIQHISRDKISDLTTNLIRSVLVKYTVDQCSLHGVRKIAKVPSDKPMWDTKAANWVSDYVTLPITQGKPTLLVPKHFVRRKISLDGHELYKKFVLDFLQEEHLRAGSSLVHVLKNGRRKVYKGELEKKYPFSKDFLFEFISSRPNLLKEYRKLKSSLSSPTVYDLDPKFNDHLHAQDLKALLSTVPPGDKTASDYHRLMVGVITFLFHPDMITPRVEQEINDGRKRIDILYANAGRSSFFERVGTVSAISSVMIPVECKNYSNDPGNPEVDQVIGRLTTQRGRLGFLFCRSIKNRARLIDRCRDAARDGQGAVIVFDDIDVGSMLDSVRQLDRSGLDDYMHARLNEIMV